MGCVQAKPSSESPPRSLEKLKSEHGYVPGNATAGRPPRPRAAAAETVSEQKRPPPPAPPTPPRQLVAGDDELVDGWPRWLVNNIPKDVLAGLVPKSADSYVKIDKVGQGTYSNVYKARDKDTGKIVALKKVRFDTAESESVKFMAREIMIMQKLDHPNVLKLEGLATSRMHYSLYLVFNFMQSDLTGVISRPGGRLTERQIKCYMHQLLSGLQHCHERGILHRDIKGSNLLIDKDGVLKIGDFGLANYFNPKPKRPLTNRVVTLWYRAPELLLGSTDYGVGIDLWSAGCLLAEMFFGRPIMPGRTEVEQLHRIFKLCGSPSGDYWRKLKLSANFLPPQPYKPSFLETFKDLPLSTKNLLTILLALEPCNRGTAAAALQSDFFSMEPLACDLSGLPVHPSKEEDETKFHRERKRHISSGRKKQHFEEIHDQKKQDPAMDILNVHSAFSDKIEKAELLEHHQQDGRSTESTNSVTKPNDNHTSPLITLSPSPPKQQQLSTETEFLFLDSKQAESNSKEQPKNVIHPYSLERSNSSSGVYKYSGDQIPNYFAAADSSNINGQHADFIRRFGLVKRSNSTSEFISFSAEWRPKYAIVD